MSQNGLNHLKSFEKLRLKAYDDKQPNTNITSASQIKGTLTIGYGHTKGVYVGQTITKAQADKFFEQDVAVAEADARKYVKVPLTQNMADAVIDFLYNLGGTKFGSSTFLKLLNAKNYLAAAEQFLVWNKPSGVLARRQQTKATFLSGIGVSKYVYNVTEASTGAVSTIAKAAVALLLI